MLRSAAGALSLLVALAATASAQGELRSGVTSLGFSPTILADLGIEITGVVETAQAQRPGALGFGLQAEASSLELDARGDDFEGFVAAELRHRGGFALSLPEARVELAGFRLSATAAPLELELRDARGRRWLRVAMPQARLSPERLILENADLRIAPELAALLGRPDLTDSTVGVLDAHLQREPGPEPPPAAAAQGGGCSADFSQPIDLLMVDLSGMTQAAREAGGRVAMAPAATLRNLGPGDVQWYRAIAPDNPVGPHPYLVLGFYRLAGGVLEQIGRSDLKHTFFATNTGCPCPGAQVLYAGCEDLYGVTTNLNRRHLAPRDEVDALARSWTSLGSHFDATPEDDFRDHGGDEAHDAFEHRLLVTEADLGMAGARYFYDGWYLAPNDTDLSNSMAYREVAPAFAGSTWSFPTIDAGTTIGSILDVWVDPEAPAPGAVSVLRDSGEGRVQLAVVTTDLGGGVHHYEYALMNFDFERQIRRFALPLAPGQTVSNADFGDANGDPLDDWSVAIDAEEIRFSAPPGQALDWGRLYNFRMDVDAAPVGSAATLTPLQAGGPAALVVPTLAPASIPIPGLPGWALAVLWAALAAAAARHLRLSARRALR